MLTSLATMLISPAPTAAQGDPVALLMVIALGVVVLVMVLRKRFGRKEAQETVEAPEAAPAPAAPAATAPGTAGKLKLHDVEPKTAAMVMAIVADKLGKPLNELRFISIKEVNE